MVKLMNHPAETSPNPQRNKKSRLGLFAGILIGSLLAFSAFPSIRNTFLAQFLFAIQQNSFPWMRGVDTVQNPNDIMRLDRAAADASSDYLVQVGRATALASEGGLRPRAGDGNTAIDKQDHFDRTLTRLYKITLNFPSFPGGYGHFSRYMMSDRVRLLRKELNSPELQILPTGTGQKNTRPRADGAEVSPPPYRSVPARIRDVKLMEWAIRAGEKRDPLNAFWPAMMATTYFAAERDSEGLRELEKIHHNSHWDAYIYEEVLGQWKLYSQAYGDNGAAQKIGPLSLVAFPHLREIRHTAELARWHAEKLQSQGRYAEALRIRRSISRLGVIMRDSARWAYEALFGSDLIFVAFTDSTASRGPNNIHNLAKWEKDAGGFLRLLELTHRTSDLALIRREIQICCDLRDRIDLARNDTTFPGIPPGIPLMPLFADWMAGVCLLQQTLSLTVLWIFFEGINRLRFNKTTGRYSLRTLGIACASALVITSGGLLLFGVPSLAGAETFYIGLTALGLILMEQWAHRRSILSGDDVSTIEMAQLVQMQWTNIDTIKSVLALLLPGAVLLYFCMPYLSHLHPAAVLLSSVLTAPHTLTALDALQLALLTYALPMSMVVLASIWSIHRYITPMTGLFLWLHRTIFPLILCLSLSYLVLISRTLSWDASASIAINQEAENDLQWVLTHNSEE